MIHKSCTQKVATKQQRIKQVELDGLHTFMIAFHMMHVCCFVETCQLQKTIFCKGTSPLRKKCIEYMLSKEIRYISSEESDTDNDGRKILHQKSLPCILCIWLRQKYAKSFRQLDNLHYNNLSTKSKCMTYTQIYSPDRSVRQHPQDILKHLLVQNENNDM